jgi:hypothetical protein
MAGSPSRFTNDPSVGMPALEILCIFLAALLSEMLLPAIRLGPRGRRPILMTTPLHYRALFLMNCMARLNCRAFIAANSWNSGPKWATRSG